MKGFFANRHKKEKGGGKKFKKIKFHGNRYFSTVFSVSVGECRAFFTISNLILLAGAEKSMSNCRGTF